MPSSFNSLDLFSSGPHRFFVGPMGTQLIENTAISPTTPGRQAIGSLDGDITIRGRLIAANDENLWTIITTITDQLTTPPSIGDLIDLNDHTFKSVSFISFTLLSPFDRAANCSVPFEARFTKFGAWS